LLLRQRRETARRERDPELLPAICPGCQTVLGHVLAGGSMLSRECGTWADAIEIVEVAD
jgi:hypothetical protein